MAFRPCGIRGYVTYLLYSEFGTTYWLAELQLLHGSVIFQAQNSYISTSGRNSDSIHRVRFLEWLRNS